MKKITLMLLVPIFFGLSIPAAMANVDGPGLFKKKCAMCHAVDKKKVGPALKDMNRDLNVLKAIIADGRKMMPKFGKKLGESEIDALVKYIQSKQSIAQPAAASIDVARLFKKKCAMCHAVDKKKVGPALKSMSRDPDALKATIADGRKMMPKFGKKLGEAEIDALVKYIQSKQS